MRTSTGTGLNWTRLERPLIGFDWFQLFHRKCNDVTSSPTTTVDLVQHQDSIRPLGQNMARVYSGVNAIFGRSWYDYGALQGHNVVPLFFFNIRIL